jgi:UDP-glucose 4-epimerase
VVVHLAAIMPSGKAQTRDFEYDVDVNGTRRLLEACVQQGVKRIVVSSSGAAYGYHADNAPG